MSGRPVRRRVLADVARTGGWQAVLARIARGEKIAAIARSFGVTPGFFSGLLHEDRMRHELVAEARRQRPTASRSRRSPGCSADSRISPPRLRRGPLREERWHQKKRVVQAEAGRDNARAGRPA